MRMVRLVLFIGLILAQCYSDLALSVAALWKGLGVTLRQAARVAAPGVAALEFLEFREESTRCPALRQTLRQRQYRHSVPISSHRSCSVPSLLRLEMPPHILSS